MLSGCGGSTDATKGFSAEEVRSVPIRYRLVWVLDQSESTDFTDPEHVRYSALDDALYEVMVDPNAAVAAVSFSDTIRTAHFTRDSASLFEVLSPAQSGGGSNLTGALAAARELILEDMQSATTLERARSRYFVSVITDGIATVPPPVDGTGKQSTDLEDADDLFSDLDQKVAALRAIEEDGVGHVSVHITLGGLPLAPLVRDNFDLQLDESRRLYAALAERGGGSFEELAPDQAVRWPLPMPPPTEEDQEERARR
jgi:hypothetical protein